MVSTAGRKGVFIVAFGKKFPESFPMRIFEDMPNKTKTPQPSGLRGFLGATDPIRTDDLLITSELLYQLSHSSGSQILSTEEVYHTFPGL